MLPSVCTTKILPVGALLSARLPNTNDRPFCPLLITAVTPSDMADTTILPTGTFTSKIAMMNCAMIAFPTAFQRIFLRSQEIRKISPITTAIPNKFKKTFISFLLFIFRFVFLFIFLSSRYYFSRSALISFLCGHDSNVASVLAVPGRRTICYGQPCISVGGAAAQLCTA